MREETGRQRKLGFGMQVSHVGPDKNPSPATKTNAVSRIWFAEEFAATGWKGLDFGTSEELSST